jgi:hypothetical protein
MDARASLSKWLAYRAIKYITQLNTIADPTNSTKQYAPYRTIFAGVSRIVIPNTTDANNANSTTAAK